jgi:hypothetical protein
MPLAYNPTIDALRVQYNAALSAYRDRNRALIEARIEGAPRSLALADEETRARQQLEKVRASLLAAMTQPIIGDGDSPS